MKIRGGGACSIRVTLTLTLSLVRERGPKRGLGIFMLAAQPAGMKIRAKFYPLSLTRERAR
jgi:hypothetical protein